MTRFVTAMSLALILSAAPALSAAGYYVVRAPHSKRCEVVKTAPNGRTLLLVGKPHSTMSAANHAMHTSVSCTQTKKGSSSKGSSY